ncbi:hypothetical protein F7018_14870 [Tenacibaculum aiptasiae]|uniref:Uncharacterized protein n=1 Tax=Tenacibaculum aiptasiae TaxID=426481 RepID=A0A7J5A9L5_9FLAO|nr:hypothetical protein [Tenacibaculum aiptasiae]KAB1154250.1 hypothetical protein F7018_14870 [Tenacibaculum aiptasiae]
MRTYPENIKELEKKHNFVFPISKQKLESIRNNIILRHDLAFLFLKSRILNSLKERDDFKKEASLDSFLDKRIANKDRFKIYNTIKSQIPLPLKENDKLFLYSLLILGAFLLPWLVYAIIVSKEEILMLFSLAYPKLFVALFLIGILIVAGFDHAFGHFFKKEKPSIDTNVLTIREFICNLIGDNRQDIKEKFEIIFKNDLENLK